jgi:hypothetical protein
LYLIDGVWYPGGTESLLRQTTCPAAYSQMKFFKKRADGPAGDTSRKHQNYLNPEVSTDGLVTCELVTGAVVPGSSATASNSPGSGDLPDPTNCALSWSTDKHQWIVSVLLDHTALPIYPCFVASYLSCFPHKANSPFKPCLLIHMPASVASPITRVSNMMMHGEALVWMDKDHPRGTMVIGGSHANPGHKAKKGAPRMVYGGGTLPPGWEHLKSLRTHPLPRALGACPDLWGYTPGNESPGPRANEASRNEGAAETSDGVGHARGGTRGEHGAKDGNRYDAELSSADRKKVEDLYHLAEQKHQSGDFEDSATLYEDILRLDPLHKQALTGFAMLMRMLGRLEDAETLYREAISIDPNYPDALCGYGLLMYFCLARVLSQ